VGILAGVRGWCIMAVAWGVRRGGGVRFGGVRMGGWRFGVEDVWYGLRFTDFCRGLP